MRRIFRILLLVPPDLRHKTVNVPLAGTIMRYAGTGKRYISRKAPLAGPKMPLAGPGLRHNFL
jgi:hypothetical protein